MGYYHWRYHYEVRKIQKVGNSRVVVIPTSYLERLNLKRGDEVSLKLSMTGTEAKAIIIEPMKKGGQDGET